MKHKRVIEDPDHDNIGSFGVVGCDNDFVSSLITMLHLILFRFNSKIFFCYLLTSLTFFSFLKFSHDYV